MVAVALCSTLNIRVEHKAQEGEPCKPFTLGRIDPDRGYVHVLDDTTLEILLSQLDTITDFTEYLTNKEAFIASGLLLWAAGEEELLAFYLTHVNERKEHDFVVPKNTQFIGLDEGLWEEFSAGPQRRAQEEADRISYAWDMLIEKFNEHIRSGTQYFTTQTGLADMDHVVRWLAREGRTRRRILGSSIFDLMEKTGPGVRGIRLVEPSHTGDPYYILLMIPAFERLPYIPSYEQYREFRRNLLEAACMVVKLKYPAAEDIVGLAMESGFSPQVSEDALYFDARNWTEEQRGEAKELQQELGFLQNPERFQDKVYDYPVRVQTTPTTGAKAKLKPGKKSRNKPCYCGSGRKYKQCCGR